MSSGPIKDGRTSDTAKVDIQNRLHVKATTFTDQLDSLIKGDFYFEASQVITLTSASESAILYFKNTGDRDVNMRLFDIALGNSSTTGDVILRFYANPTAGTLITEAVGAIVGNNNFSSAKTIVADTFVGSEGKTLSGQPVFTEHLQQDGTERIYPVDLVLPKGSSVGVSIQPPTSNTSMQIRVLFLMNLIDED